MGPEGAALYASLLVSVFGTGLFIYGRKQHRGPHLLGGIALMAGPYFLPSAAWILVFGVAAAAATFGATRAGL